MTELRPIGTEFEFCFPPSRSSTDTTFHIWRYRVVAHDEVAYAAVDDGLKVHGEPWGHRLAERIDPVEVRKFQPTQYVHWLGEYRPVPPPECAELLDAGWQALFAAVPHS